MAERTWSGVLDGNWTLGTNWSGAAAPVAGDIAIFNSTAVTRCTVSSQVECAALELRTGYTGECVSADGGAITVSGGLTDKVLLQSGTLSANGGRFSFIKAVTQSGGVLQVISGGLATFSAAWDMAGGLAIVGATIDCNGTPNISAGTMSCSGAPTIKMSANNITFTPTVFTKASSIVEFDAGGDQTITINALSFYELKASVSGTKTVTGSCPTYDILTEAAPAVFAFPNCLSTTLDYRLGVSTARKLARGRS